MSFSNILKVVCLLAIVVIAAMGCGDKTPSEGETGDKGEVELKSAKEDTAIPATPVEETPKEEPGVAPKEETGEAKTDDGEPNKPDQEAPKADAKPTETAIAMVTESPNTTVSLGGCLLEKAAPRGAARSVTTEVKKEDPKEKPDPQQDIVTVTKDEEKAMLIVNHALAHNCCYSATVKTEIDKHKIRVTEALSGETCRCMCNSTITTRIKLKGPPFPKQYHVTVVVDNNGTPGTTHEKVVFY